MPHIVSIAYTPAHVERKPAEHYARVPHDRAVLVEGRGIVGDVKGAGGDRQLSVERGHDQEHRQDFVAAL